MTSVDTSELESASRSDLIARAEALGIEKADVLTRAELLDEIVKRTIADPTERRLARGLLGAARDLVARVVERGLHLPDAAAIIRGLSHVTLTPVTPPIATVTLAEIYAGQGHRRRALAVLDEVLANEPDHDAARVLRDKVAAIDDDQIATIAPPEPEVVALDAVDDVASDVAGTAVTDVRELAAVERDLPAPDAALADYLGSDDDLGPDTPRDVALPASDVSPERAEAGVDALSAVDDQLVLVAIDAASALACWEMRRGTLDSARARLPGGVLTLRIVAVTASWDGPISEVRDVDVDEPAGDWRIDDLPAGAVLRAAVGWRSEKQFDPLAVALDVLAREDGDLLSDDRRTIPVADPKTFAQRRVPLELRARRRVQATPTDRGPTSSSWRALAIAPWEPTYEAPPLASLATS
jgi:hypothetical protein